MKMNLTCKTIVISFIFFSFLQNSCTVNSVVGTVRNSIQYSGKLDEIQVVKFTTQDIDLLLFDNTNEYESNLYFEDLLKELQSRRIQLSSTEDSRFELFLRSLSYSEDPSTDTYTDDDGDNHEVDITKYHFKIAGTIIDHGSCKKKNFYAEVNDNTRAGKTIFGTVGEVGMVTTSGMATRAIYRFSGKTVKNIERFLEEKKIGKDIKVEKCNNFSEEEEKTVGYPNESINQYDNYLKSNRNQIKEIPKLSDQDLLQNSKIWLKDSLLIAKPKDLSHFFADEFICEIYDKDPIIYNRKLEFDSAYDQTLINIFEVDEGKPLYFSNEIVSNYRIDVNNKPVYLQEVQFLGFNNYKTQFVNAIIEFTVINTSKGFKINEITISKP